MSLRTRLTVAAATAVAIAVGAAAFAVYFPLRAQLRHEVDASLLRRVDAVRADLAHDRSGEAPEPDTESDELPADVVRPEFGESGAYVQLLHADGRTVRAAGETVVLPAPPRARRVAGGTAPAYLSDELVSGVHVRVATAQVAPGLAVQVARPLGEIDASLARIRLLLLLVAAGGVALAAALGRLVARTALSPVAQLTGTAERVAATQDLSHTISVRGSDEVARLGTAFNEMMRALQGALDARRQLVADASHELRTPLTSLRTNVEVLERLDELPSADRDRLLRDIGLQIEELTHLVGDLMELARGEEPWGAAGDVRLDHLVGVAIDRTRRHWPAVRFESALAPVTVHGVAERLERAVANLLDNAAKWSPPAGVVQVEVADGGVSVRDHGPGIPAADLPHVFDRFYRATTARSMPGSGLGLAIVRQVAEAHGGSVTVERPADGGTLVRLRLPG